MKMPQQWLPSRSARYLAVTTVLATSALLGCGPAPDSTPSGLVGPAQGPCGAVIERAPDAPGLHAPQDSPLSWPTNPPAEGTHYPVWAPWAQAYATPVPRGNWLHNAEHGGVVLLYRCQGDCPDVVTGLAALGAAQAQDAACQQPINARWLLTPDPLLPDGVQVAAVAWGYAYRATCLDPATLQAFITAHYAKGPEDFCSQGAINWN